MKKFTNWMLAVLLVGGMASCAETPEEMAAPQTDNAGYKAILSAETRTVLGEDNSVIWEEGDQISVYEKNSYNQGWELTSGAGTNEGDFTKFVGIQGSSEHNYDYFYAVYPYDDHQIDANAVLTVTVPEEQIYTIGGNTLKNALMTARSTDRTLPFTNAEGLFRVKVYAEIPYKYNITGIQITTTGESGLVGTGTVDLNADERMLVMNADAGKELTVTLSESAELPVVKDDAVVIYAALPPTEFGAGELTFTFNAINNFTGEDVKQTLTLQQDITLNRNKIISFVYRLTEEGWKATTTPYEEDTYVNEAFYSSRVATEDVTINGAGKTITMVLNDPDNDPEALWLNIYNNDLYNIFSSSNGSTVTVNDLTFAGETMTISLGHYQSSTYTNYNTVFNNVDIIGLGVLEYSRNQDGNIFGAALCCYGVATLNDCNVYDTYRSALDQPEANPIIYDAVVVNYSTLNLNTVNEESSHYGSIYAWQWATINVGSGVTVDKIQARCSKHGGTAEKYQTIQGVNVASGATVTELEMNALTKYGAYVTIEAGATVGTLTINSVNEVWDYITIDPEAEVGKVIVNGTEMSVEEFYLFKEGNLVPEYDEATKTYTLKSANDLKWMAAQVNEEANTFYGYTLKLANDIDLKNAAWTPVGQKGSTFLGTFDGAGYTISNFTITAAETTSDYATGFFGHITPGQDGVPATIQNVKFDNATVTGHHWTAVVAGYMTGKVSGCSVSNSTVTCTHANDDACGDKTGAVVGYLNESSKVLECSASNCTITAGRDAGQLVGCAAANSTVSDCSATEVTVTAGGDCTDGSAGKYINNDIVGRQL